MFVLMENKNVLQKIMDRNVNVLSRLAVNLSTFLFCISVNSSNIKLYNLSNLNMIKSLC